MQETDPQQIAICAQWQATHTSSTEERLGEHAPVGEQQA